MPKPPAQQPEKKGRAATSATTRAQNRKKAEEAQLKEADTVLGESLPDL